MKIIDTYIVKYSNSMIKMYLTQNGNFETRYYLDFLNGMIKVINKEEAEKLLS